MMSKTHIVVAAAAALLALRPDTGGEITDAVIGGAVGGVVCDIDAGTVKKDVYTKDAVQGRIIAAFGTVAAAAANIAAKGGMFTYFAENLSVSRLIVGAAAFAALCVVGRKTVHRTFTHSFLAYALFCGAVYLLCPPLLPAFAVGFGSHLALDLLSYRPLLLFYPWKKGFSLKLCYARSPANDAVFVGGLAALALIAAAYAVKLT